MRSRNPAKTNDFKAFSPLEQAKKTKKSRAPAGSQQVLANQLITQLTGSCTKAQK
jgi:hypothetical protein